MLEFARLVGPILQDVRFEQYLANRTLQLAVERAIEIVGEAARRVSTECKATYPQIPWSGIVSQRNVLAHEYGEIRQERLWIVATQRIPELVLLLESLGLPQPPVGDQE
jgi:uncharacterized protein with HEPN domain